MYKFHITRGVQNTAKSSPGLCNLHNFTKITPGLFPDYTNITPVSHQDYIGFAWADY